MHHTYLGMPAIHHPTMERYAGELHVHTSILSLIRHGIERGPKTKARFFTQKKTHRRYMIAALIQAHKNNNISYRQVMFNSKQEFVPRYYFDKATENTLIAPEITPVVYSEQDFLALA